MSVTPINHEPVLHLHMNAVSQGFGEGVLSRAACGILGDKIDAQITHNSKDVNCPQCKATDIYEEVRYAKGKPA